ncbi:MAG TPA: RNA 2',3'-cyclic phosphodiesterase [Casimicrobiaceae bacterium]|nr:RNA 2',3'-cyclic phosphodiesterase [Casimicrobiaceae bacterium]
MADPPLRLFFALWPDAATQAAIAALANEVASEAKGRAVAADNVHLTLAFLGEQPASRVPELCALAAAIDMAPFQLALDEIGCFRKTGIAWLGAGTAPPELVALHSGLARALEGVGIALDARPFAPHLTLARRAKAPVRRRLARPVLWSVASFALVYSETLPDRARYRLLEAWHAKPAR